MEKNIPIHINLEVDRQKLLSELDSHFIVLKTILNSVDDGTYNLVKSSNSGIIKMVSTGLDPKKLKENEIAKCFKSCIGSLQDFMDKLIAIIRLKGARIMATRSVSNDVELQEFLNEKMASFLQDVAKDKKLKAPDKLNILQVNDPSIRAMVDGYFSLRNSIEHHKSIAGKDINFTYRRLAISADNLEITALPFQVSEGQNLKLEAKDETRFIPANSEIILTENEVEQTIECIKLFISIYMTNLVSAILVPPINNGDGMPNPVEIKVDVKFDAQ